MYFKYERTALTTLTTYRATSASGPWTQLATGTCLSGSQVLCVLANNAAGNGGAAEWWSYIASVISLV